MHFRRGRYTNRNRGKLLSLVIVIIIIGVIRYANGDEIIEDESTTYMADYSILAAMENENSIADFRKDGSEDSLLYEEVANENARYAESIQGEQIDQNIIEEQVLSARSNSEMEIAKLNDIDYLRKYYFQVDNTTSIDSSELNASELLSMDMSVEQNGDAPSILIYHTHSQEGYVDSVEGDMSTTVVGVGEYLAELLRNEYGYNVLHHEGVYDKGDRDHAYSNALSSIEEIVAQNPSIQLVIDLHRDGVSEDTRLVTQIGDNQMAQIMFFCGLSRTTSLGNIDRLPNPYIKNNLALALQMQVEANRSYPGLTRRIYLKGYRYNMHICPKCMLVEVGAQTNTLQEAKNAMIPLADIISKVVIK